MSKAFMAGAVAGLALVGCGGGGSPPPNPYAGSYAGNGTVSSSSDKIETYVGIGGGGTLCGALKDEVTAATATFGGSVSGNGQIAQGSIQTFDSTGKSTGTGTVTGSVQILNKSKTGNVTVAVNITATIDKSSSTYTFSGLQGETAAAIRDKKKKKKT